MVSPRLSSLLIMSRITLVDDCSILKSAALNMVDASLYPITVDSLYFPEHAKSVSMTVIFASDKGGL